MTKPGVEVTGARQLASGLDNVAGTLDDLNRAQVAAGQVVKQRAAGLAPVLTGALARSIVASTGQEVTVGSNLVYAGVQEMGWAGHNISAQPFLRPALADSTTEVAAAYETEVQASLSRVRGA